MLLALPLIVDSTQTSIVFLRLKDAEKNRSHQFWTQNNFFLQLTRRSNFFHPFRIAINIVSFHNENDVKLSQFRA